MKFNSKTFKIFIAIALVFMLIPIAAADNDADCVYGDANDEVLGQEILSDDIDGDSSEDESSDDEDIEDDEIEDEPFVSVPEEGDENADLQIVSFAEPERLRVGDTAAFTFIVTNNGPDTAVNVVAYANTLRGDVLYVSSMCDKGVYDPYTGVWEIGDLECGESAMLVVIGKVLSGNQIITMAYVTSDTPDPDESDNIFYDTIEVEGKMDNAEEAEKLPAAGNPILMALLALFAMIGAAAGKRV